MRPSLEIARLALERTFGYDDFRAGQVDVVASVLSGADTLGVLPTGGGKSLCYQVPALVLPGTTVVISPLISLMKDQVDRLVSLGVAATFLNSTLPPDEARRRLAAVGRGIVKLLYVAPERFRATDVLDAVERGGLAFLAVDEAHCISEWGHEFRPSFRRIADAAARFPGLQVVALTATATPAVRRDIATQLRMRAPRVIVGGFDRPNLSYAVRRCANAEARRAALVAALEAERGLAVVYASTRADVMRVARDLARRGIRATAYHGGLSNDTRQRAQDAFMREQVRAIVATNAFGMGIDKPNVRLVVHYAMPGTLEAYYQEAGRAGRDGRPGHCLLLHGAEDRDTHDFFIRSTFPDAGVVEKVFDALKTLAVGARVPAHVETIARRARLLPGEVSAAMRFLEQQGALKRGNPDGALHVRLMALPARIAAELGPRSAERLALRALWRRSGEQLMAGVRIEPGADRPSTRILRALRDRQFLELDAPEDALMLADPSDSLAGLGVDLAHLGRRRAAEQAKLQRMVDYVNTTQCRRRTVLAYFGERRADAPCGRCDNCLQRTGRPRR